MEVTKIYWREDALNNMKSILASRHRKGKKAATIKKIIANVTKGIEVLKKRPYTGYIESSMANQPHKIYSHFLTNKGIKALYYTENDALYIIDFRDD